MVTMSDDDMLKINRIIKITRGRPVLAHGPVARCVLSADNDIL